MAGNITQVRSWSFGASGMGCTNMLQENPGETILAELDSLPDTSVSTGL